MSNTEIYRKTIGMPCKNAVLESGGDFAKYFKRRGERSVGGKAFEAKTAIKLNRFFAKHNINNRLLITAVEGLPGDASDLIRINGAGEVIEKYQLKLGYKSAMSALKDSRYIDNTIVTPPDVLKEIKRNLKKEKGKNIGKGKLLYCFRLNLVLFLYSNNLYNEPRGRQYV